MVVLAACLEVWEACQVAQVECQTWVVPLGQAVLVDPLSRRSTKPRFLDSMSDSVLVNAALTVSVSDISCQFVWQ